VQRVLNSKILSTEGLPKAVSDRVLFLRAFGLLFAWVQLDQVFTPQGELVRYGCRLISLMGLMG